MFIITKYAGNAYAEKLHTRIATRPVNALNRPAMNGDTVSVSGHVHNFISVGAAANPSLSIANTIATAGSWVMPQSTNARSEQIPQR